MVIMQTNLNRRGQSLIEALVGLGIAAIFIIGSATIIAPSLIIGKGTTQVQAQTQLATELLGNINAWSGGSWNSVLALATGTLNTYYLTTTSSPFFATTGTQSVVMNGITFTRYFYLTNIYRDSNGAVTSTVSANFYDPSSEQVNVVVTPASSTAAQMTYVMFITRSENNTFTQTSWMGSSGQNNPVKVADNNFANSNGVTISSQGIQLTSGGNSCVL